MNSKKHTIIEYIILNIQTGRWMPGSKIPSAGQLAIKFDTTIQTIHKTLSQFIYEKILITKPKVGYFVKENNYISPNDFLGISDNKKYKVFIKEIVSLEEKYKKYNIFEFKTQLNKKIVKIHYIFLKKEIMEKIKKDVFGTEFWINKKNCIKPNINNFNTRQCLALIGETVYKRKDSIRTIRIDSFASKEVQENLNNFLYVESKTYNNKNNIVEFAKTFLNLNFINWEINLKIKK